MKSKLDKLDVDKLLPVPFDLSKLNDVTNDAIKKDVYNTKIKNIEDKIASITNLVTKAKINVVKGEIPSIANLATKTAVNAVENKIPNINNLVEKTGNNIKIIKHIKYIKHIKHENMDKEILTFCNIEIK